eukprot:27066-Chlamydomonas_euryale.AAC.1
MLATAAARAASLAQTSRPCGARPCARAGVTSAQLYHTVTTVSGIYNQWQTRIHYYHWLKVKAHCKAAWTLCEMGGFTRLLHSGSPDNIMHEIPTVVVDPMPSSMLKHDDYVVLNRPYALLQWVQVWAAWGVGAGMGCMGRGCRCWLNR